MKWYIWNLRARLAERLFDLACIVAPTGYRPGPWW